MSKKELAIFVLIIAVLGAAAIAWMRPWELGADPNTDPIPAAHKSIDAIEQQDKTVAYACEQGKTITATFHLPEDKSADIALSDGRQASLARAISGSGARYADPNEQMVFWNKGDAAFLQENGTTTYVNCMDQSAAKPVGLANPASVNCEKAGGQLKMASKPDGSQYGLCYFDDNRACEEWALLRGACAVGGVKTAGYDTDAQKFCAWSGGQTLAEPNAVCTFPDGSTCLADAFYAGTCTLSGAIGSASTTSSIGYVVEKTLDTICRKDIDCSTPPEYLAMSRCPFTAKCLEGKCAVVCPQPQR